MSSERHHDDQRRQVWPPEAGFFRLRLVRKGWAVPCQIVCTDDELWQATIDGEALTAHADPAHAPRVADIWHGGHRIDEAEYLWCLAVKEHAAAHDPDHPALNPRQAISPMRLKPL
jgi:hypothetical protein